MKCWHYFARSFEIFNKATSPISCFSALVNYFFEVWLQRRNGPKLLLLLEPLGNKGCITWLLDINDLLEIGSKNCQIYM